MSLPLPEKIVTSDVSRCGNGGSRSVGAGRAGGERRTREMKNARGKEGELWEGW